MLKEVVSIDYFLTATEHEALLLEEELIKTHKPRYNLRLKDDKSYPYIRIALYPQFPSITFARKKMKKEGLYFGPFTSAKKVREGIKLLRSLFLLRGCEIPEQRFPLPRPCIDYDLRLCSAPCVHRISQADYHRNVEAAIDFLNGNYEALLSSLENKMWEAAEMLDFETAVRYRDQLDALRRIVARYRLVLSRLDDVDFVEAACGKDLSVVVVLRVRKGRLIDSESFVVESGIQGKPLLVKGFIEDFYLSRFSFPSRACVYLDDFTSFNRFLQESGYPVLLTPPLDAAEEEILHFALENAEKNLEIEEEKLKQKSMWSEKILEDLRARLHLDRIPHLVEGIDISTFQGEEAVGVIVSFQHGLPYKKRYRKFIIRETDYPNDYLMLAEVVRRHFERLKKHALSFPDLLLVDGGIGQLHAVLEVLQSMAITVPTISLAKEHEQIYIPAQNTPITLPSHSEELKFLQRVRNEAHRFAITFHRVRRNKKLFSSLLEEIEGIGPMRQQKLLSHYDSLLEIAQVPPEEISKNLRIPLPTVIHLQKRLREVSSGEIQRSSEK